MKYDAVTTAAIDVLARNGTLGRPSIERLRQVVEERFPGAVARAKARIQKESFDNKFKGPVPDWAKRYVRKYGRGYVSSLTIRQSRTKPYTSGHCWYSDGRLVVTLSAPGSSNYGLYEQQATVLHEIAHVHARWDQHGDEFYDHWYRMLRDENLYRQVLNGGQFVGVSSLKAAARRARSSTKAA